MFNRTLKLSSGKKLPHASGPNVSWILASTTNKYAGLMVRFKTMSQERWERIFKTPKSLGSANNGIWTAELSAIFAGMARIALNARLLIPGRLEGIGWFTDALPPDHRGSSEHEFLLLFDRTPDALFEYGPMPHPCGCFRRAPAVSVRRAWFDYSVTRALRKWKRMFSFPPTACSAEGRRSRNWLYFMT